MVGRLVGGAACCSGLKPGADSADELSGNVWLTPPANVPLLLSELGIVWGEVTRSGDLFTSWLSPEDVRFPPAGLLLPAPFFGELVPLLVGGAFPSGAGEFSGESRALIFIFLTVEERDVEGRFPEQSRAGHAHAITRLARLGRSASQMSPKRSAGCGESAGCHAEWVLLKGRRKQNRTDTS